MDTWDVPIGRSALDALTLEGVSPMHAEAETTFDVTESYAAHGGALFAFALNALGDRAEAQDCVQEAFIRAWRSRERYSSSRGSVRTWLFAIERNLVTDALRARARRPTPSDSEKIEWASEPVTEDLLIVDRLALSESLATLSYEHRQVIVAVQLNGVGYQELSEQIGVPVATLGRACATGCDHCGRHWQVILTTGEGPPQREALIAGAPTGDLSKDEWQELQQPRATDPTINEKLAEHRGTAERLDTTDVTWREEAAPLSPAKRIRAAISGAI